MSVPNSFKKVVQDRDLKEIRMQLFGILAFDLSLRKGGMFDEMLTYCLSHNISEGELFQDDDGEELPTEISKDNMSKICALMGNNFSKRKLEAAQRMGAVLYPEKKNPTQTIISNSTVPTGIIVAAAAVAVVVGVIIAVALG